MKKMFNWVKFLLMSKGPLADEMVNEGLVSYEGQGRDKYGK